MWPYHPELLATPVPRYTSFPTAAEFTDAVGTDDYARALSRVSGEVSLYVHIPFCEKICWYCGCNTGAANRKERLANYLDALQEEIALVAEALPEGARVTRLSFGGGSPNAVSPVDFVRLFNALTVWFRFGRPEVSIELDPRTMTENWVEVLASVGATRASLGVQTFDAQLQAAIGRVQPAELIERTTGWLRQSGVTSLNFDLMYGLPGQDMAALRDSIDRSSGLGADRIALFGYAHVPHIIARQRRIDAGALPDQDTRFAMAAEGFERLSDAGYAPVGFDHFALPGDAIAVAAEQGRLHRNFQGFTDDAADCLIGLGVSAISILPGLIAQNEKNAGRYRMKLSQGRFPASLGVAKTADDARRGAVIEQLLCDGKAIVAEDLRREAAPRLAPFVQAGLCAFTVRELAIAPGGLPYARSIAAQFDPYRQHSPRRFSSAV